MDRGKSFENLNYGLRIKLKINAKDFKTSSILKNLVFFMIKEDFYGVRYAVNLFVM